MVSEDPEDAASEEDSPSSSTQNLLDTLAGIEQMAESISRFHGYQHIDVSSFRDPLGPELRKALQSMPDPEAIEQFQQLTLDPEVLNAIQQLQIDPTTFQALPASSIDPKLIQTLEAINSQEFVNIYRTAAAIEQIDEEPENRIEEKDIEDAEAPEQKGFLSTFLNITALYILQQPDKLSSESTNHLESVLESESLQAKSDALRNFADGTKDKGSTLIVNAGTFAFYMTWALYFGDEIEAESE